MALSPILSAIMCDGMGWFEEVDFKRALLVYDRVQYLLPERTVPFRDISGKIQNLLFPRWLEERSDFAVHHFGVDATELELLTLASSGDIAEPRFAQVVSQIPEPEQLYTWRVVNADPSLGAGESISLGPTENAMAHALLLNKFMLAAHSEHAIPITGKGYVHRLLSLKYDLAVDRLRARAPEILPPSLRSREVKHGVVVAALVSEFVSDDDLEHVSFDDVVQFRRANRPLFERFSLLVRELVDSIDALPSDGSFGGQLRDALDTGIWRQKDELEVEMRENWLSSFRSAAKAIAGTDGASNLLKVGAIAVGVIPALSLGSLVGATAIGVAGATSWGLQELVDFTERRSSLGQHGLYYLLRFTS